MEFGVTPFQHPFLGRLPRQRLDCRLNREKGTLRVAAVRGCSQAPPGPLG